MFGDYDQICSRIIVGRVHNKAVILTLSSFVLNAIFIAGTETSNDEKHEKSTHKDFNVETASDDEIKDRLKHFGVHYSLESVLNTLEPEAQKEDTVKVLLSKFFEEKMRTLDSVPPPLFRHPIISIDGFFTHGRSKVAKMVAAALHGRRMLLPTRHIARLRNYITSLELRKQYYSLAKYMGANMARRYCRSAPVILERYWHDQVAFVIAKTFSGLVPENSSVYDFPKDLLVPDLIFFVNGALNQKVHNESSEVHHVNNELAQKIAEVFRRIKPKPIEIGPPSLPLPMVKKILAIIDKIKSRFLPKPLEKPVWRNH